jgi:uncharacterized membrane protein YfcA
LSSGFTDIIARMLNPWYLPLLFGTGLAAGFVDSIAGGGGLITMPVLSTLFADPTCALGTNKLQACFGSSSAAWHYGRAGTVDPKDCGRGFILSFVGAAFGSWLVLKLDPHLLKKLIPVLLLLVVALYVLLKPRFGAADVPARMSRRKFDVLFGLGLGFYDGFFGPGTGTFWALAFALTLGFSLIKATGYTKVMNFASNLASLIVFLVYGKIDFLAGSTMGVGQLLGARVGARLAIKHGARFIRPIFITVVLAITAKLLRDVYFK